MAEKKKGASRVDGLDARHVTVSRRGELELNYNLKTIISSKDDIVLDSVLIPFSGKKIGHFYLKKGRFGPNFSICLSNCCFICE